MNKELEIKVLNINLDKLFVKLKDVGAIFLGEENQINYHISSSKFQYIPEGSYLRIRELTDINNNVIKRELTYKENILNGNIRENNEYNSEISDSDSMLTILKFLGYDIVETARKKRFVFTLDGSKIDIDIWEEKVYPYPYMEIEVESFDKLNSLLEILSIDKENISLKSIKQLQNELK